jgi:hypothetical protein
MHQGGFARVAEAWRQMGGWLTSRNCRWVGEEYYTRELPATTSRACPATASPGRWYGVGASSLWLQGDPSAAGLQACSKAATAPPC